MQTEKTLPLEWWMDAIGEYRLVDKFQPPTSYAGIKSGDLEIEVRYTLQTEAWDHSAMALSLSLKVS